LDLSRFDKTIIIVNDFFYPERPTVNLQGREFRLKEPLPQRRKARDLSGFEFEDEFFVVSVQEFIKVVPESTSWDLTNEILIPSILCTQSLRPKYINSSPRSLL